MCMTNEAAAIKLAERDNLVGELVEALDLALEYWAHRQQRYSNRHPAWVVAARAAIAKAREGAQS